MFRVKFNRKLSFLVGAGVKEMAAEVNWWMLRAVSVYRDRYAKVEAVSESIYDGNYRYRHIEGAVQKCFSPHFAFEGAESNYIKVLCLMVLIVIT